MTQLLTLAPATHQIRVRNCAQAAEAVSAVVGQRCTSTEFLFAAAVGIAVVKPPHLQVETQSHTSSPKRGQQAAR